MTPSTWRWRSSSWRGATAGAETTGGLDLERLVYRAVNGGDQGLPLMLEAMRVRMLPVAGPSSWLRDRLGFLGSAVITTVRVARAPTPPLEAPVVACLPGSENRKSREARAFFLRHHFGLASDCLGRGSWRRPRGRPSHAWWRWWLLGVISALLSLADWSERRYTWLGGTLVDLQLFKRLERELREVYVFGLYDRRQYVILTFLARHTGLTVTAVYQNIPLARNCRHLHVPVPVVLTSKVNLEEAAHYGREGTFLPSAITYAGQEFVVDTHDLAPSDARFDIGYYSSGEWARREGLYRTTDVERVRRGEFAGNAYAVAAASQLEALTRYVARTGRTLRIYPHPIERGLRRREGIEPPYAALADRRTVTIDEGEGNSRRSMYEVKVAVSLQSSFIWERLDLGLDDSFIYEFPDPDMTVFERAALGRYARNVYRDEDELIAKVDAALRTG